MLSEDIIRADGTVGPVGQRFEDALPAQSGSGGPVTHDLGNFEFGGGLSGVSAVSGTPVLDLGPGAHVVKYTVALVTVDWGGGNPASGFSVDLTFTDHADENFDQTVAAGWADVNSASFGVQPPSLYTTDPDDVRYAAVGRLVTSRYAWLIASWNEDLPDASATVHLVVEVTV